MIPVSEHDILRLASDVLEQHVDHRRGHIQCMKCGQTHPEDSKHIPHKENCVALLATRIVLSAI